MFRETNLGKSTLFVSQYISRIIFSVGVSLMGSRRVSLRSEGEKDNQGDTQ